MPPGREGKKLDQESVLVIAEAGVNHNGSVTAALELVDAAAASGANIVKFQTFDPAEIASTHAPMADYQKSASSGAASQRDMLEALVLKHEDLLAVRDRCSAQGIEFLSTAFDKKSLDLLIDLGVKRIKVPSGEITHKRLLESVANKGLPVILSTGMAEMWEISDALEVVQSRGLPREAITVLHCTSSYPAPHCDLNLRAMTSIANQLGVDIGYSDHSLGPEAAVAAVALGARVIEKHITLDRTATGPDHAASMEPDEFTDMVIMIRNVEMALGDGKKRLMPSEANVRGVARRSLTAAIDIAEGAVITDEMICAIRPGNGMSPMEIDRFIGQRAERSLRAGETF